MITPPTPPPACPTYLNPTPPTRYEVAGMEAMLYRVPINLQDLNPTPPYLVRGCRHGGDVVSCDSGKGGVEG